MTATHYFLIHGPPGTGKTKTLSEVCRQLSLRGKKILICSPSNTGVDNLIAGIQKVELKCQITRIGNPSRISQELDKELFDQRIKLKIKSNAEHRAMKKNIQQLQQKIDKMRNQHKTKELKTLRDEVNQLQKDLYHIEKLSVVEIFEES